MTLLLAAHCREALLQEPALLELPRFEGDTVRRCWRGLLIPGGPAKPAGTSVHVVTGEQLPASR